MKNSKPGFFKASTLADNAVVVIFVVITLAAIPLSHQLCAILFVPAHRAPGA